MLVYIRNYVHGPYSIGEEVIDSPVPHKWLNGDTIDPTTNQTVSRTTHRSVVGIVEYLNRTGQGFTSRGIPLYLFHPLDPAYPPMIVASSSKPKQNMLCVASIEHWKDKWPRAGIQKTLGPVGDRDVERYALCLRADVPALKSNADVPIANTDHYKLLEGFTFHIDPEGCEDVDDVLVWNETEFGICIADVAQWVPENSEYDVYAEQLGQTLYVDGTPIRPMLPSSLSTQQASLRSDTTYRLVVAYIYTFQDGVCSSRFERRMIQVQHTYTYDSVYKNKELCSKLTDMLQTIWGSDVGSDSHRWIEIAMILYNRAVAQVLRSHGKGILRYHNGRSSDEWSALAEKTECPELAHFGSSAGMYVCATSEHVEHAGLGLDVYCHASSPLRRYADLVNQRWLHHLLFQEPAPTKLYNIPHLNHRGQIAKQLDRDLWYLERIHTDTITDVRGILLRKKSDSEWTLYVPEWKRKIRGKSEYMEHIEHSVGDFVHVRVYTDLRKTNWANRIVCSFS